MDAHQRLSGRYHVATRRFLKRVEAPEQKPDQFQRRTENRLTLGIAYVLCNQCGGKLWEDEGHADKAINCPYLKGGICEPTYNY